MTEPLRFEPLEGRTPEGTLQNPMRRLCKFAYQCRYAARSMRPNSTSAWRPATWMNTGPS